jgi:hypothetical protein
MVKIESPREAALRRIAEQEARLAKQKRLIATLKANRTDTFLSERLLATMEDALTALRASLRLYRN